MAWKGHWTNTGFHSSDIGNNGERLEIITKREALSTFLEVPRIRKVHRMYLFRIEQDILLLQSRSLNGFVFVGP